MEFASSAMRALLRPVRPIPAPPSAPPSIRSLGQNFAASRAMHDLYAMVARLAPSDVTVTLTGETGTGKDVSPT